MSLARGTYAPMRPCVHEPGFPVIGRKGNREELHHSRKHAHPLVSPAVAIM